MMCGYDSHELQPRTRLFATTGVVLVWLLPLLSDKFLWNWNLIRENKSCVQPPPPMLMLSDAGVTFLPHCMECRQRSSDENSVCPWVRLSNAWFVTKWKKRSVQIFISYERSFSLVFWEEEWLVGVGWPFYVKFLVNQPPLERNSRFSTNIGS